jgi:hypothetical protein
MSAVGQKRTYCSVRAMSVTRNNGHWAAQVSHWLSVYEYTISVYARKDACDCTWCPLRCPTKGLNATEGAHMKSMSAFEADEHLRH